MIGAGYLLHRFLRSQLMKPPIASFVLGNLRHALLEQCLSADRQVQVKVIIGRSHPAKQAWVEPNYLLHRRLCHICHQTKIDAVMGPYRVDKKGGSGVRSSRPYCLGFLARMVTARMIGT